MPDYKVTFIFDAPGHGFTETWWKTFSSANLDAARDIVRPMAVLRARLLASDCGIIGYRISNGEDVGRIGQTYYDNISGEPAKTINDVDVAINIGVHSFDNQDSKRVSLRGVWDEWVVGGTPPSGNPEFMSRFNSWAAYAIANGFGWRGVFSQPSAPVTNYVQNEQGLITYELGGNLFTGINAGTRVKVRCSKINKKSPLNVTQIVSVVAANECTTVSPIGCGPFVAPGTMYKPTYTVRNAANMKVERVGNRKAGAPLLRSPGRAPVKAKY